MLTVLEALNLSTEYLEKKNIESARMNAELLLADILSCKRLDLYLSFDKPIDDEEKTKYREFISRRSKYEPLQYIIGNVEFYGREFIVDDRVLIPRQETEILIETVLEYLEKDKNYAILDIGTGSGIIPITIAKERNLVNFTAIDVSLDALEVAEENSEKLGTTNNIKFMCYDVLGDSIKKIGKFDVIISNPPYVSEEDYKSLQNEIIHFEPKNAVSDEDDGFKFYKRISAISENLLKENGKIFFEVGEGQSNIVQNILIENGFSKVQSVKDYLGIERVIIGEK